MHSQQSPAMPALLPCPAGLIDPVVFELYGGDRNTPAVRRLPLRALCRRLLRFFSWRMSRVSSSLLLFKLPSACPALPCPACRTKSMGTGAA